MRFTRCTLHDYEEPVRNGLAVTPSDMEMMTASGKAVASGQLSQYEYHDGYRSPSDLPLPLHRGRSLNDNWEMQKQFQGKMRRMRESKALQASLEVQTEGKE